MAIDRETVSSDPLKARMGSSFKTHNLFKEAGRKLVFKPTALSKFFAGTFVVLGALALLAGPVILIGFASLGGLLFLGVGGVFFSLGLFLWRLFHAERLVDSRRRKIVYPEWKPITKIHTVDFNFDEVTALQILSKVVTTKDTRYECYELNFVHPDGKRSNFLNHSDYDSINVAAREISMLLGCEVFAEA